jgi:small subunit ribosomal protein S15
MARIHARRRGNSGSAKPVSKIVPGWVSYKPKEVEDLVIKLAKKGMKSSQIGQELRDSYGIPDVTLITKKSISKILREKDLYPRVPEDLQNLIRRSIVIRKHMDKNKKDKVSKRGLQLTEAKILRLVRYYKRKDMLPKAWKYDPKKAELLIE